jgi:hypothetical protein
MVQIIKVVVRSRVKCVKSGAVDLRHRVECKITIDMDQMGNWETDTGDPAKPVRPSALEGRTLGSGITALIMHDCRISRARNEPGAKSAFLAIFSGLASRKSTN